MNCALRVDTCQTNGSYCFEQSNLQMLISQLVPRSVL